MVGAHINFNFQARLNKESTEKLYEIQMQVKKILPHMNPTLLSDLHVTLGESSYFSNQEERIKIDPSSRVIGEDYDCILSHLKSYSFKPIANLTITRFRITDNGFVVVDLNSNKEATFVSDVYRKSNFFTTAELTKHYRDPENFTIHISLGKIEPPKNPEQKEKMNEKMAFIKLPAFTFFTKNKGVFSVSYNEHKKRYILKRDVIPFRSVVSDASPIVYQYNSTSSSSSFQSSFEVTREDIKTAIGKFVQKYPLKTKSIGIHMPTPFEKNYKITFISSEDAQIFIGRLGKGKISSNPFHVLLKKEEIHEFISFERLASGAYKK